MGILEVIRVLRAASGDRMTVSELASVHRPQALGQSDIFRATGFNEVICQRDDV